MLTQAEIKIYLFEESTPETLSCKWSNSTLVQHPRDKTNKYVKISVIFNDSTSFDPQSLVTDNA